MSFTLTYKNLSNPNFLPGIRKLVKHDDWKDPKKMYNVARLSTLLDQELKTFYDLRAKHYKKVQAAKSEGDSEAPISDEDKAKLEALSEETEKLYEVSFEIPRHKVDFNDLEGIPLSPSEMLALEPLLDNLPE